MNKESLFASIQKLKIHVHKGQKRPHKPVLLLYMLVKCLKKEQTEISLGEAKGVLNHIFNIFFPSVSPSKYHEPFYRLTRDLVDGSPFWLLTNMNINTDDRNNPFVSDLKNKNPSAYLAPEALSLFKKDRTLLKKSIESLIFQNFPESLHEEVKEAFGIPTNSIGSQPRDPKFRPAVLQAYNFKCCVCNFNLRLMDKTIGLEAGHIKMVSHNGPNTVDNGLAFCPNHHKLFDLGVFTVNYKHEIHLSNLLDPVNIGVNLYLTTYKKIILPNDPDDYPNGEFLKWHNDLIFEKPIMKRVKS